MAILKAAGAEDQFTWYIEDDAGHLLSERMWKLANECFNKTLRAQ